MASLRIFLLGVLMDATQKVPLSGTGRQYLTRTLLVQGVSFFFGVGEGVGVGADGGVSVTVGV